MTFPTLMVLWALATVPAAAVSVLQIAAGHPYFIARHGEQGALQSWADLRGLPLYTTRTVYFTPRPHPDWLTERTGSECTPEPGFLATLAPF
ncbi:hypothetical protein [Rhodobacter maris]|uniref:Uncharacterized protein n=1 Tax=Rhodobacter maris TaxID=446682 RepID=A0A285SY42_9RHOB|nr:hypothetical protein [Rhodobacter maris]SOC13602.1 hypothetical protein SAMN05877831_1112 [Rhodobacter maris]